MNSSDLDRYISEHQIRARIVHLAMETPTVETAAQAVGAHPDQIGKSILFLVDGKPLLVIANGMTRIDQKRLAQHFSVGRKRVKLANGEQVLAISGYPAGTLPPFGHRQKLPTLIEAGVLAQREIYAGGGELNALLRITTAELQRVVAAEVVTLTDFAGNCQSPGKSLS